jgi:circadian clock protein KaiC
MKKNKIPDRKLVKEKSQPDKVQIRQLLTGVRGLDEIIGGGLPEFSFNLIVGAPGCGKTTLAHQIIFANATPQRPALYFTILGEPALKMLRYQQQYSFFDPAKLNKAVRFINLNHLVMEEDLAGVLNEVSSEVVAFNPGMVVVDSFRNMVRKGSTRESELQTFVQRLALLLTGWEATTFLIGEYSEEEMSENPVFTVADGSGDAANKWNVGNALSATAGPLRGRDDARDSRCGDKAQRQAVGHRFAGGL